MMLLVDVSLSLFLLSLVVCATLEGLVILLQSKKTSQIHKFTKIRET